MIRRRDQFANRLFAGNPLTSGIDERSAKVNLCNCIHSTAISVQAFVKTVPQQLPRSDIIELLVVANFRREVSSLAGPGILERYRFTALIQKHQLAATINCQK